MAISEKNFQPADYQKYVERGPDSYVNWEEMSTKVTKLFTDEATRRENIKADIDDRTQSLYDQLAEVEVNKDGKWSDEVISSANQIRKALSTYNSLLKKGAISVTEYKTQMERVKGQMSELNIITKELGSTYDLHQGRLAVGENGEILAAPDEIAVFNSASGYGKLKNTKIYIDPVTMNAFMYKINEDGSIPDFTKNPEKFMAINNARAILNYTNDRSQYVISDVAKGMSDQVGTFINERLIKYTTKNADGTYVISEEGIRLIDADPNIKAEFDDLKNIVFEKLTAEGDKGIANTIATLNGNYIMAMSEDEFKAKGGTDLKYFIKINPDAADGMTYEFHNDAAKQAAIDEIKADVSTNLELMLGKKKEVSSPDFEPDESERDIIRNEEEERQIGFLSRVQDIAVGDLNAFSSGSAQGIQDINGEIRSAGGDEDDMIDSIKRQGDSIVIEYMNGRTETIDRKDSNGKFKDTEGLMSELYQLVIPAGSRSDKSFDDLLDMYTTSGKTISKSTRDMTENEIRKELEVNKAIEELKKGNTDPDYEPTPAEIKEKLKDVKVTDEEVKKAKDEGRITYQGEDAVGYSSRDPYNTKSSGDAIIRGEGDQLPTMTGEESLQQSINDPDDPNRKKLPNKWFEDVKVDGAMEKVLDAYLPRRLRNDAEIKVGDDNKLVVTYKGATIDVPGVTDMEVNTPNFLGFGGTTYEELNKAINKAANSIINKENEILRTRGGGGALPSAY